MDGAHLGPSPRRWTRPSADCALAGVDRQDRSGRISRSCCPAVCRRAGVLPVFRGALQVRAAERTWHVLFHAPALVAAWINPRLAIALSFLLGTLCAVHRALLVLRLRSQRQRSRLEMFAPSTFALIALATLLLPRRYFNRELKTRHGVPRCGAWANRVGDGKASGTRDHQRGRKFFQAGFACQAQTGRIGISTVTA